MLKLTMDIPPSEHSSPQLKEIAIKNANYIIYYLRAMNSSPQPASTLQFGSSNNELLHSDVFTVKVKI